MTEKRKKLLEKLSDFRMVPGHGPDLSTMTDEQLEKRLWFLETAFTMAWNEDSEEGDDL
ncbi:hypothetical protein [Bacillus velezensis]|uniref:hypothetical protein n=1 Tax=Bacillus velezensis TaxID=492670 RepID=UPI0018E0AFF0|nr:hypothetical protein [Bacillus velezensis]